LMLLASSNKLANNVIFIKPSLLNR
jgi:hypothetical protein